MSDVLFSRIRDADPATAATVLHRAYAWPTTFVLVDGLLIASRRCDGQSIVFMALQQKTLAKVRMEIRHETDPPCPRDFVRKALKCPSTFFDPNSREGPEELVPMDPLGTGRNRAISPLVSKVSATTRRRS